MNDDDLPSPAPLKNRLPDGSKMTYEEIMERDGKFKKKNYATSNQLSFKDFKEECVGCGFKYPETLKQCPRCKLVNLEHLHGLRY